MASLRERIEAEKESLSGVLEELEKVKDKPDKTTLELAGIGAFLHNIYTGVENTLKHILGDLGMRPADSASWHQELLLKAAEEGIITETTKQRLAKYLAFRHFFVHGYSFSLEERELRVLIESAAALYSDFASEVDAFLSERAGA